MAHSMTAWLGIGIALGSTVAQALISWGVWKKTVDALEARMARLEDWRHETDRVIGRLEGQHEGDRGH